MSLVAVIHGSRLTALNVVGEEPRRGQVAVEMIRTGDWIVPRQQGELFLSRPPLQNWVIGLVGMARGQVDRWAIRLPSVLAVLGVVLLIHAYGRTFLSRAAAWVAAAGFASMVQVIELGRLGETDMMFTLLVSASLLLWHYGRTVGWSPLRTWTTAYLMVALGTLCKGPQAPAYFAATVGAYLLVTWRWRDAVSWSHLAGIGLWAAVVGAWQIPYTLAAGFDAAFRIYGNDVAIRFDETTWRTYVEHFFSYPAEILFGCLLPWSLLLVAYVNRDFWRKLGPARDHVVFLVCALAVTFPTVWFVPTARGRYYMPLYPCFALLAALVAQRCWEAEGSERWAWLWRGLLTGMAAVMALAGPIVLGVTLIDRDSLVAQPLAFAVAYLAASLGLAAVAFWARLGRTDRQRIVGAASVALFLGLTVAGAFTNSLLRRTEDQADAVARVRERIPASAKLVSLGLAHHVFTYHYGEPVESMPVPKPGEALPAEVEYFCFHNAVVSPERLDFPFETLEVIPCDRFRGSKSNNVVTVCRRPPATAQGGGSNAPR
ncbi:MAG: glycosyltransferase family 39 protein [Pirellulales bacterium]|nr:glycosyltransferase family 39 protein [Pirellulales bacterium]